MARRKKAQVEPEGAESIEPPRVEFSWRSSFAYAVPRIWKADRGAALAILGAAGVTALVAPLSALLLGLLVTVLDHQFRDAPPPWVGPTPLILAAGALSILAACAGAFNRYGRLLLRDALHAQTTAEILQHAGELELAAIEDRHTQDMLERAQKEAGADIFRFGEGVIRSAAELLQTLALAGVLLWAITWAAVVLLFAGAPLVATRWLLSRARHQMERKRSVTRRWTRYYGRQLSSREATPGVHLLGLRGFLVERFRDCMDALLQDKRRIYRYDIALSLAATLLTATAVTAAMLLIAQDALAGGIGTARFVVFWAVVWRLRQSLSGFADHLADTFDARYSMGHTREFLEKQPRPVVRGGYHVETLRGELEARELAFQYPGKQGFALRDISFRLEPGEVVALVGGNGAGKTTLAKLIAGLYEPHGGAVLLDGVPLAEYHPETLYRHLGFVFQENLRFEATAGENLALGDVPRLWDRPQAIAQAAQRTGLEEIIARMPHGYDTRLGRLFGEYDLSGGQWRRFSIARVLARDPRVVLFDEPTASLDAEAEYRFYQDFLQQLRGRTSLIVSHRFATARLADRVLVLEQGELVEQGPHLQLLARGGIYAAMYRRYEQTCLLGDTSGARRREGA